MKQDEIERFNAMMNKMNEELIRNEQIYAQSQLEKERRAKEQERKEKETEQERRKQAEQVMQEEQRQRKLLEQQLLEMRVKLMLMNGSTQEEISKECKLTEEAVQQIVKEEDNEKNKNSSSE